MGNDNRRDSSGSAILTLLFLGVALLLITGLAVAGAAALWLMRTQAEQSQIIADQQLLEAEMIRDRLAAERDRDLAVLSEAQRGRGQPERPMEMPANRVDGPQRTLVVRMDRDGKTSVDGQAADADAVRRLLENVSRAAGTDLDVQIHADRRCAFEHVVAITSVCEAVGIREIRFRELPASDPTDATD